MEAATKVRPHVSGAELIWLERLRQVDAEGWTAEHDDRHVAEELALAAASYAVPTLRGDGVSMLWPWAREAWKPGDRIRELTKAGALIAAEIDRLQRVKGDDPADETHNSVGEDFGPPPADPLSQV